MKQNIEENKGINKTFENSKYSFLSKTIITKNGTLDNYSFVFYENKIDIYDSNNNIIEIISRQ